MKFRKKPVVIEAFRVYAPNADRKEEAPLR